MKNTLKSGILSAILFLFVNSGNAQVNINHSPCGTEAPSEEWNQQFQKLVDQMNANASQPGNKSQQALYTIPVIIHVIHGGQPVGTYPNLAQGQLNSQILVLNNDFAGNGFNAANYPLNAYSSWAANSPNVQQQSLDPNGRVKIADCQVQFCLATRDTLGNILPEPGIDRINYISRGWNNPAAMDYNGLKSLMDNTIKPQTIWNVSRYLNIWVSDNNVSVTNLLGYATFPILTGLQGLGGGSGTSSTDGFWCYAKCFGSITTFPSGVYYQGNTRGRTSTHEIGHWLGLRHIWGDGNCANDFVSDTPPASSSNFGAPNYPFKTTACTGNSPNGEMFMNFMDYTDDPAKYMFTTGQANRILTAMANSPYRKFLGTHNLCSVDPVAPNAFFSNSFIVCPNVDVTLFNSSSGFPVPSYTWSSTGGTISDPSAFTPVINFPTTGTYVVTLAADNGTLSVFSKTITVTRPAMSLSPSTSTICSGEQITLSASGFATYTWEPGGFNGSSVVYSPAGQITYTVMGTQNNGCQNTGTVAVRVDACTGISAAGQDQTRFSVYPNPAKDVLHISYLSDLGSTASVAVIDALGKEVFEQELGFTKEKQNQTLNISALSKGVYFVKISKANASPQFTKLVKE